jgi:hypothetical protein
MYARKNGVIIGSGVFYGVRVNSDVNRTVASCVFCAVCAEVDVTLRSMFTANCHLAKVVSLKFATWPWMCTVLCRASKQMVNLSVHQDGGLPVAVFRKYWAQNCCNLNVISQINSQRSFL